MIRRSQTVLQAARTAASACRVEMAAANHPARSLSSGPTTATPPADASRGATADLCDVFLPDPVDVITESKVSIVAPLFRFATVPPVPSCVTWIDPHHNASLAHPVQGIRAACLRSAGTMAATCASAGRQPPSSALRTTLWSERCATCCRNLPTFGITASNTFL